MMKFKQLFKTTQRRNVLFIFLRIIIVMLVLAGMILIGNKIISIETIAEDKEILAEIDGKLTSINDDIDLDEGDDTIFEVYADGNTDEYFEDDLDEYGEIPINTIYAVKATGENVKIDCSGAGIDVPEALDYGEAEVSGNTLIYQDGDKLKGIDLLTNKTSTLLKFSDLGIDHEYVSDYSYNDNYTLLRILEYIDEEDLDEEGEDVVYLYNNKTKTKEEIYRDNEGSEHGILDTYLKGDVVRFECEGDSDYSSRVYEYNIQKDKMVRLSDDGHDILDTYKDKLLIDLPDGVGVRDKDTGDMIELDVPSASYETAISLYKDKVICYDESAAEFIAYDCESGKADTLYEFPVKVDSSGVIDGTEMCTFEVNRMIKLKDALRIDISLHGNQVNNDYPGHQGEGFWSAYYTKQYHFVLDIENKKMKYIQVD